MSLISERPFWDLGEADLDALALAPEAGPAVPPGYVAGVVENLAILQAHARILAAALTAMSAASAAGRPDQPWPGDPSPGEAFEP